MTRITPLICWAILCSLSACSLSRGEIRQGMSEEEKLSIARSILAAEGARSAAAKEDTSKVLGPAAETREESASGLADAPARPTGGFARRPIDPVSGVFKGLPLAEVFRSFSGQTGWAIILRPGVPDDLPVQEVFTDVPIGDVLERIGRSLDVAVTYDFGRKEAVLDVKERRLLSAPWIWALRPLDSPLKVGAGEMSVRYAVDPGSWTEQSIRGFLSRDGKVIVDPVSGTILVEDRPSIVHAVASHVQSLAARLKEVTIEIGVIRTNEAGPGIDWSKVGTNGGGTPAAVAREAAGRGGDPLDNLMSLLAPYKPEVLSRPRVSSLSGWGLVLNVTLPQTGKGWQMTVVPHVDGSSVLVEATGALVDEAGHSFSTASRMDLGTPLIISPGAATVVSRKSWGREETVSREILFVVRVLS